VAGLIQVLGNLGSATIGGSVSGSIKVGGNVTTLNVGVDVSGLVQVGGNLNTLTVGHDVSGLVNVGGALVFLTIGNNLSGTVQETGTMQNVAVGGSVTSTGLLSAVNLGNPDAANVVLMTVGPDFYSPGHDMAGRIVVSGTLGKLRVAGGTPGTIDAGHIGAICVYGGFGPLVLRIKDGGVQRRVEAAVPANPYPLPPPPPAPTPPVSPAGVRFQYVYESAGLPSPQWTARVFNTASTAPDQYDLSLVVYSDTAKFNLARLDAAGVAGVRNVAVEGDLLTAVTAAATNFFKLPDGSVDPTPAGVQLPLDALAGVGIRDNVTSGTVRAASLMGVAYGSLTEGGVVEPSTATTQVDAATVPTADTAIVRANDTFRVPFADVVPVTFFLATQKTGGHFDSMSVLFTDQGPPDPRGAVTALIGVTVSGNFATIQTIDLRGDYGAIQTQQVIAQSITSTGPVGDLLLKAAGGIVANVTAPSYFGNIDSSSGPISGTIQTTGRRLDPITGLTATVSADFGRLVTDATGKVIGVTTVHAVGGGITATGPGITGALISRGNFVSQVVANGGISGLVAAQGDLGALVGTTRLGGLLSHGPLRGEIVTLGRILGDVEIDGGLQGTPVVMQGGRIAARGGIVGNLLINGDVDAASAIISGGEIGDPTAGTALTAGAILGIVAAEGPITLARGATQQAAFYQGNIAHGSANAAAIDAVFSPLSFDLSGQDLGGLNLILQHLLALKVSNGTLTM
jgi:hypothetical protein